METKGALCTKSDIDIGYNSTSFFKLIKRETGFSDFQLVQGPIQPAPNKKIDEKAIKKQYVENNGS